MASQPLDAILHLSGIYIFFFLGTIGAAANFLFKVLAKTRRKFEWQNRMGQYDGKTWEFNGSERGYDTSTSLYLDVPVLFIL